jgi:hypothetical protein
MSIFLFVSCMPAKEVVCDAQKAAVTHISGVFGEKLQCTNVAAIEADLNKQLEPLKLCTSQSFIIPPPVRDAICPVAVDFVVKFGVSQLPASWGCKGGIAAGELREVLSKACLGQ